MDRPDPRVRRRPDRPRGKRDSMAGLLIPLAWLSVSVLLLRGTDLGARRRGLVLGAVATGAWLVLATELLGAFEAITFARIRAWWLVTDVAMLAAIAWR